ncbi:MAG: Rne/Rng family ribonuclease, partial [Thermodesulfovibrionales bacterium]
MAENTETPENNTKKSTERGETPQEGTEAPAKTGRRRTGTSSRGRKKKTEEQLTSAPSEAGIPIQEPAAPEPGLEPAAEKAAEEKPVTAKTRPSRRRAPRKTKTEETPVETAEVVVVPETVSVAPEPEKGIEAETAEAGEGEQPAAEKKKRRRRRRRPKKAKPDQAAETTETGSEPSEEAPAPETAEAAEAEEEASAEASEEEGEQPAPGTAKKRRRRRRSKKGKPQEVAETAAPRVEPVQKHQPKDRTKRILINARYPEERRVAIVEGDSLVDFYVEVASKEHLKGNIYKGVVASLMPGLQAAFVDFGQRKQGFLQIREVMPELLQNQQGRGSLVKGQEILVQVEKDERDTKGASLTTYISIPGRYIVMMPGQKRVGISRRIESREDRDRLKETFNSLKLPKDMGFILRTACGDSLEKELSQDLKYLTKLWDGITADAEKAHAPSLIYKEHDIAMRTVRDYLTTDVAELLIDDKETYTATKAFLRKIMPSRKINVTHYKEKKPLFSLHNVEAQIARLSESRVRLPSQGYLIFDKTEALTAIDVNSGRSRKEDNVESMALATNLEAAEEIGRQLRLRDIGGLVVIDFIDMESSKNRRLVERRLEDSMSTDKANTEITGLSKFCILEMTR